MTKASQKLHCVFSGKEFPNYEVQKADLERKVKWCQIYRLELVPKKQGSARNHKQKSQIKRERRAGVMDQKSEHLLHLQRTQVWFLVAMVAHKYP